jgi:hypothetical protein
MNRILAFFGGILAEKHQSENFIAIDAAVDHELVTLFENVEGNNDVRKQNEIRKGEKGNFHFHP